MRTLVFPIAIVSLCVLLLAGATSDGESRQVIQLVEPAPYRTPSTPDELVANFELAVNERNIDEYAAILHPEFEFAFVPAHRAADAFDTGWSRERELDSMARLFAGEPDAPRLGRSVPGVDHIEFALVAADDWIYASTGQETWSRTYHSFAKFYLKDGTKRLHTRQQLFTLTKNNHDPGLARAAFKLLRREELGCDCSAGHSPGEVDSRS